MTPRKGLLLEQEAHIWIQENARFGHPWSLLNGKGVFDIESKFYAVDVASISTEGYIRTERKDLRIHYKYMKDNDLDDGIIMFKNGLNWYVLPITEYVIKKINGRKIKYEDVKGICQTAIKYFVDDVTSIRINEDTEEAIIYYQGKVVDKQPLLRLDRVLSS